jgi:hypothetical protein
MPEGRLLSNVLLLSAARESAAEILPSLTLLDHAIRLDRHRQMRCST